MTIGDKIKKRRLIRGIQQSDLAEAVNVSKQTLYKYENNQITNIPSDKIESISKILEVTPSYLMGWDEQGRPPVEKLTTKALIDELIRRGAILAEEIIKKEKYSQDKRERVLLRKVLILDDIPEF